MSQTKFQFKKILTVLGVSLWTVNMMLTMCLAQTGAGPPKRASGNVASQHAGPNGLAAPSNNAELDQAIEAHFQQKKLPGLVVLYARDGLLVYKNTKGFADVESQTKVTENHIFRLASVSKLVAAALALREQELGKIQLSEFIKSGLPEIPDHHTYTLRDLLSCRSGVRHYGDPVSPLSPKNWSDQQYATDLEAIKNFWHDPLVGIVGQYSYSTPGYSIAGARLEKASGKPLPQLLRDTICTPHGLATLDSEDRSVNKPMRVSLYKLHNPESVNSGNQKVTADNISWKRLGGGLECSAMDLLKFGIKLSDGKIISKASLKTMMTRPDPFESYALGCNQAIENGLEVFAKSGGQLGTSTYIWCIPERRMTMVVLINRQDSGGASELGKKLRGIVLNKAGASGKKADLIAKDFKKTSGPQYKDGHWEVGFAFTVANIGQGPADQQFVNGVRLGDKYRWSGFIQSLAPNGTQKSVSGKVKIADPGKVMGGRTIDLVAMADAPIAAADTSMDPNGRILESNEGNNEDTLSFKIPGGFDELAGTQTNTGAGSEIGKPAKPPKRVAPPQRVEPPKRVEPSKKRKDANGTEPQTGRNPNRNDREKPSRRNGQ